MSITCIICPTVTMSAQNRTEKKISEMMERRWSHVHTEYSEKHHWRTKIVIIQASLIDANRYLRFSRFLLSNCRPILVQAGKDSCYISLIREIFSKDRKGKCDGVRADTSINFLFCSDRI